MKPSGMTKRRWFGAVCLVGALLMLVAGRTKPGGWLDGVAFILYWIVCLVLTVLAMMAALVDMFAVSRENRNRQRTLIRSTIERIPPDDSED